MIKNTRSPIGFRFIRTPPELSAQINAVAPRREVGDTARSELRLFKSTNFVLLIIQERSRLQAMHRYNEVEVTCGIQHIANTSVTEVLGGPWRVERMKDCVLDANAVLRYFRVGEAESGDRALALFEQAEKEQAPPDFGKLVWPSSGS